MVLPKLSIALLLLLSLAQDADQADPESLCFDNLRDLEKTVYHLKANIIGPDSSSFVEEKLSHFFSLLPDTLTSCIGVFDYDLQSPASGDYPDLSSITGCRTGYTQFISQVRRIAKALSSRNMPAVSIATERLSAVRSIMFDKCSESLGP